jgi:2',3'-cyclic-nucleotide 2'-phosphodiesterase (5'-nucleotidase family)
MFTVGDAMLVAMNAFGIDVFTPGNWDFGYGGAVFRNHFASKPPFPTIPGNIRTMSHHVGCDDVPLIVGLTDGDYSCSENTATAPFPTPPGQGVIKASFDAVAANLYNAAPLPLPLQGQRVLEPYKILQRDGVTIAVIGLTAAIVPQQADTFNIGLRFTQGVEELPGLIEQVKTVEHADLIVVQSELGLSQNIRIAQLFDDIDVVYSAHTHEVTLGALLVNSDEVVRTTPGEPLRGHERSLLAQRAAIVVETNRDMYVGRLDLEVNGNNIVDFAWQAIPVDAEHNVAEDPAMAQLVAAMEADFTGAGVVTHVFSPGGFVPGTGLRLNEDLDTVVGYSDTLLLRHHVLEDTLNNFLADAIREVTNEVVAEPGSNPYHWTGVDLSMANGFRFGNAVLPGSAITLRDLYTWFPIAPAVNVADFSGKSIAGSLNTILNAVFDRNAFLQRGGWYVGLSNMEQKLDLKRRPYSSSSGRIVETTIGGQPLDPGKRYVFASCYGHGNPLDEVCRTGGGANFMFFELDDPLDYNSDITLTGPVNAENVISGTTVKQVAPTNFLHPVHALRRYLDTLDGDQDSIVDKTVTAALFGGTRVKLVDSTTSANTVETKAEQIGQPDNTPDTTLVQPPFGAGPKFFSGHYH